MSKFEYTALLPKQSDDFVVFTFCAKASDIFSFAHIDRIGRLEDAVSYTHLTLPTIYSV